MSQLPILSFLIFLPIIVAVAIIFLPKNRINIVGIGFVASLVNFLISLKLIFDFDKNIEFNFI